MSLTIECREHPDYTGQQKPDFSCVACGCLRAFVLGLSPVEVAHKLQDALALGEIRYHEEADQPAATETALPTPEQDAYARDLGCYIEAEPQGAPTDEPACEYCNADADEPCDRGVDHSGTKGAPRGKGGQVCGLEPRDPVDLATEREQYGEPKGAPPCECSECGGSGCGPDRCDGPGDVYQDVCPRCGGKGLEPGEVKGAPQKPEDE